MSNIIKKYFKPQALYLLTLILFTGIFTVFIQLWRAPDIESVTAFLSTLPYYENTQKCESLTGTYKEISDEYEITVYKSNDGTSLEFAVADTKNSADTDAVIEKLKARKSELDNEFSDNPDELKRIDAFKIISVDNLVTFMVYDTQRTAENSLHNYFKKSGN